MDCITILQRAVLVKNARYRQPPIQKQPDYLVYRYEPQPPQPPPLLLLEPYQVLWALDKDPFLTIHATNEAAVTIPEEQPEPQSMEPLPLPPPPSVPPPEPKEAVNHPREADEGLEHFRGNIEKVRRALPVREPGSVRALGGGPDSLKYGGGN
jgi:hypothetical protein